MFANSATINVSAVTDNTVASGIIPLSPLTSCESDRDCFDNDGCTADRCNITSGACEYDTIPNCGSTSIYVREHRFTSVYDTLYVSDIANDQSVFQQQMADRGEDSTVSEVDDIRHETLNLKFNFSYFDSIFERISISPNGVVSLPPFQHCEIASYGSYDVRNPGILLLLSYILTLFCVVFSF